MFRFSTIKTFAALVLLTLAAFHFSTAYALLHATNALLPYSLSTIELGEREEVKEKTAAVADLMLHGLLRHKPGAATDPGVT